MSIWAEPSSPISPISPIANQIKPSNERNNNKMSNYNFDAIQSVPFDATHEQILSSISISTSSKSDDEYQLATITSSTGIESKRMSSLLQKLGSYFSHANNKMLMSPTVAVAGVPVTGISIGQPINGGANTNKRIKIDATVQSSVMMGQTKRHIPHTINSSHSDKSSNSANSSHSTQSTEQLCSSVASADKRNIDQCVELTRSKAVAATTTVPMAAAAAAAGAETKATTVGSTTTADSLRNDAGESFTLPRVNLKQSATTTTTTTTTSTSPTANVNITTNSKTNLDDKAANFERHSTEKRGRERSTSQYSTEKSGSSGYYSSNIGSIRSSVDEHIYSEPLIDALQQKSKAKAHHGGGRRTGTSRKNGLDNLESSIKSLELHLKQLNRPTLPNACDACYHDDKRKSTSSGSDRLPTIMEGIDVPGCGSSVKGVSPAVSIPIAAAAAVTANAAMSSGIRVPVKYQAVSSGIVPEFGHCWQNTVDDSLMDIDLDSFLLANEVRARKKVSTPRCNGGGLDNPSYVRDTDDDDDGDEDGDEGVAIGSTDSDKYRDNNYKCTKYVNSCPEDAYNVEGVIGDNGLHPLGGVDKSLSLYLRKCENQVHYQNTRDILEDIREKLNALLDTKPHRKDSFDEESGSTTNESTTPSENQIHENILSLRNDLENYLKMMNRQNEIEIKQFCSGLSKNYKLLTIQQAMENKARSRLSDYDFSQKCIYYTATSSDMGSKGSTDSGLEANRELSLYRDCEIIPQFDTVYVHDGLPFAYNHNNTKYAQYAHHYALQQQQLLLLQQQQQQQQQQQPPFHLRPKESMRSSSDSNFHMQPRRESMCSSCGEVAVIQCGGDSADTEASTKSTITGTVSPIDTDSVEPSSASTASSASHIANNLAMQQPTLITGYDDKELMLDWHRNKPSIWEQYYGSKRLNHAAVKKIKAGKHDVRLTMSYPSSRPESDFTLDVPRAEQLRVKMKKEKRFRSRCRIITSFLSFVFFLLTVMTVSLILTRGKRMFGSML